MVYKGRWFDRWLPAACLLCGAAAPGPMDLCTACEAELPRLAPGCACCGLPLPVGAAGQCGACLARRPRYGRCIAAFPYVYPVRELLLRFKSAGDLAAGRLLAELLAGRLAALGSAELCGWTLVPVPLHPSRLARRGFNQAERIARVLAGALGLELAPGLACRQLQAADQKRLGASARQANLRGVFTAGTCSGRRIAIVDDVVTTGATAEALAAVLRAAGAAELQLWCIARAL